jgi:2-keto-4-pentenoate hydratase/2-oxohepta-3-ene-1,7-dioic acid hydratase in catechol pathway
MKLGLSRGHPVAFDETRCEWRRIDDPRTRDIPGLLSAGPEVVSSLLGSVGEPPGGLPFQPGSLRGFGIWEAHMICGAKGMVQRFGSAPLRALAKTYETVTRSVLPAMRPRRNYYRFPQYYMGNHRSLIADGEEVPWPSFSGVLDFELEIGVVISRQVRDCTPEEGLAAIGGFCVVNDWTARDTQWDDIRNGTFGGVVKAKTFASAMSPVVVTADEILPRFMQLSGRVRVNGTVWCEGTTAAPVHRLGAAVAYAAMGETLYPGDLLSTGTLPGCSGLELCRFPLPGDEVRLEIDGIGALANRIGRRN